MNSQHRVLVFGISGVGKSGLLREFHKVHEGWNIIRASQTLSNLRRQSSDELRKSTKSVILANQALLAEQYRGLLRQDGFTHFAIDSHSLIDNDKTLIDVPLSTVDAIGPTHIIFVKQSAAIIRANRANAQERTRPVRSVSTLAAHQRRALRNVRRYAKSLKIQLFLISATDKFAFELAMLRIDPQRKLLNKPWASWLPGVLSKRQLEQVLGYGLITNGKFAAIDQSAVDLHIGTRGYKLKRGCLKPNGRGYLASLIREKRVSRLKAMPDGSFVLSARKSYLFVLAENIRHLRGLDIWGQATARSSVGRMDVLARLVVDGMNEYEGFEPQRIGTGELLVEITPMTFDVVVRPGVAIVQLRLFQGNPTMSRLPGSTVCRKVMQGTAGNNDGSLSVDLTNDRVAGIDLCAFSVSQADAEKGQALRLWSEKGGARPDPRPYWRFDKCDKHKILPIETNRFYIIRSLEKLKLPGGIAVYCRASDESIGEMRIHYAGFVHPFFGHDRTDGNVGTPLIFEVRGHDVIVNLRHGEKMARLEFYRMSSDCQGSEPTDYGNQILKLSKYFGDWPQSGKLARKGLLARVRKRR